MSEIMGLKLEEVAEVQKSSLSAVKSRVSRGRMKLQELLGVGEHNAPTTEDETRTTMRVVPSYGANGANPLNASQNNYHTRFAFQAKEKL